MAGRLLSKEFKKGWVFNWRAIAYGFGSGLGGFFDELIRTAAAEYFVHRSADFSTGGVGVGLQKRISAHQLAGSAKTALDGTIADKSFLQGVQGMQVLSAGTALLVFGQPALRAGHSLAKAA